jgi:hypothetical protein
MTDQEIVARALTELQLIAADYINPGPRDAEITMQMMLSILDRRQPDYPRAMVCGWSNNRLIQRPKLSRQTPARAYTSAAKAITPQDRASCPSKELRSVLIREANSEPLGLLPLLWRPSPESRTALDSTCSWRGSFEPTKSIHSGNARKFHFSWSKLNTAVPPS